MQEMVVDAKIDNLPQVTDFITAVATKLGAGARTLMQIELVVEEIFVNIASYAYKDKEGQVVINIDAHENPTKLELTFTDEGIPYNPLDKPDPDVELPIEERGVGGLGIFLVKKNVDEISYEHKDGKNCLRIGKIMTATGGDVNGRRT